MGRVLVVDDDPRIIDAFQALLADRGHEVATAGSAEQAMESLAAWHPELVVMDVCLPGMTGLEALGHLRQRFGRVPVIIMTGESSMSVAIEASRLGAHDYRVKPFDPGEMLQLVERVLAASYGAGAAPEVDPREEEPPAELIGHSAQMQEVYRALGRVAITEATVLIRGESGTGKECAARAIHRFSAHSHGPLVAVNCVAIPEALLESELFGHERGSFTGAVSRHEGKFEQARNGTIFLDEIGDLPRAVQGKILRVLQERSFERVGGRETLKIEARIVSATNRDMEQAMRSGGFREDLFHRLNVVTIRMPALREHKQDLPELTRHFLRLFARRLQVPVPELAPEAAALIERYDWPGNVRELQHCLERAIIFSQGYAIGAEDIRRLLSPPSPVEARASQDRLQELVKSYLAERGGEGAHEGFVDEVERLLLVEALRLASGRQSAAARLLGLPRPTLHAKLRRHGVRIQAQVDTG